MNKPLVSIVIASYNYGSFLAEAIESALRQTHEPVEVVVVDDGSSDDSVEVARRYPIRVIVQMNQGVTPPETAVRPSARASISCFWMPTTYWNRITCRSAFGH